MTLRCKIGDLAVVTSTRVFHQSYLGMMCTIVAGPAQCPECGDWGWRVKWADDSLPHKSVHDKNLTPIRPPGKQPLMREETKEPSLASS